MDYEWETVVKKGGEADMTMAMRRPVTIMKEEENPARYIQTGKSELKFLYPRSSL